MFPCVGASITCPAVQLVHSLKKRWAELNDEARRVDKSLESVKRKFTEVTQTEVDDFHDEVQKFREAFIGSGPGTGGVVLDKGMEQTTQYITELANFNKRRDELVLAQKLFNLPLTSFPELVEMESDLELLRQMFELYSEFKARV